MLSIANRNTIDSKRGGLVGLNKIVNDYGFLNAWSSENITIDGTTTTFHDYKSEHDLANPAATNQATYSSSDVNLNNLPSLTYDGIDDYNYKSTNDFRIGDNDGAIYMVFRTPSSLTLNQIIFCVADELTNTEKIMVYINSSGVASIAVGTNVLTISSSLSINTNYVLRIQSNGSTYTSTLNNVSQTVTGTNDGKWFNDFTLLSNITIGGRINTGTFLAFSGSLGFIGYSPLQSGANDTDLVNDLKTHYGI